MNGIVFVAIALAGVVAIASGNPGHAYGAGYGFIAAGHGGHAYGHGHYSQPGVAKVQANQNNHAYEYGLNEHGPHYTKTVHQGGNFAHTIAVAPVAVGYAHHGHAAPLLAHGHGHVY